MGNLTKLYEAVRDYEGAMPAPRSRKATIAWDRLRSVMREVMAEALAPDFPPVGSLPVKMPRLSPTMAERAEEAVIKIWDRWSMTERCNYYPLPNARRMAMLDAAGIETGSLSYTEYVDMRLRERSRQYRGDL